MRGFAALELDDASRLVVLEIQKRLRTTIERQGVRFTPTDRLHVVLATWDFADPEELEKITSLLKTYKLPSTATLSGLTAGPVPDRPASVDIGVDMPSSDEFLTELALQLSEICPAELPKRSLVVNLTRISPASKKIGYVLKPLLIELAQQVSVTWNPTTISVNVQEPSGGLIKTNLSRH